MLPKEWMAAIVAVRIHWMTTGVDLVGDNADDSSKLLEDATDKANALLETLLSDQAQLAQGTTGLNDEAMQDIRSSLSDTIAAVTQTIQSLEQAQASVGIERTIATVANEK